MKIAFSRLVIVCLMMLVWSGCGAMQSAAPDSSTPPMEAPAAPSADIVFAQNLLLDRKVIANADVDLVVLDTDAAVTQIETLAESVGGYISDTNLYKSNYEQGEVLRGSLTLRIPAERLDETLGALTALAVDVPTRSVSRQDVTEQYSDIEAQLRNLRATETELLTLLGEVRAKPDATPEDIIAVYNSLTEIRGQIEQIQGRKNLLDSQIALSTVTVELIPDALNQPVVVGGWRPGVIVRDAMRALVGTLQFLGSAAIWVGVYLIPLVLLALIPIVIVGWLLRTLARRLQRRRRA